MARNFYTEVAENQNHVTMLDGFAYRWFDFGSVAAGGIKEYLIEIPPDPTDLYFYGRDFSGRRTDFKLEVFAGPTFSSKGTIQEGRVFNRNGDFDTTKLLTKLWKNPTILTDGVLVDYDETYGSLASGNKGSGGSHTVAEFPRVMPKGQVILARITNLSAGDTGNFIYKLFWSEVEK